MKKILTFLTIVFIMANCSVPYDGETRYIFETTILDSGNNPIPNLQCNVVFYNLYGNEYKRGSIFGDGSDLIVSSVTDANGKVRLIFPFADSKALLRIEIESDKNYSSESLYQFINLRQSDFNAFKRTEPAINIYKPDESVFLNVKVISNSSNVNKRVSKVELLGKKIENFKDFNRNDEDPNSFAFFAESYKLAKNQTVTLKYEVITQSTTGQLVTISFEEQITIVENNINYEISLL